MEHDPVGTVTAIIAVLTLPVGLLTGLFATVQLAAAVFIVGWLLLVPLIPIVGNAILGIGDSQPESVDPVERLKDRYAAGEIDEAEFDRRLTELVETAHESAGTEQSPEKTPNAARETELEQ